MIATQQAVKSLMEKDGGSGGLQVKVGSFSCPDAPGIYRVTGVGFKPKRVAFFVSKAPGSQTHFCCSAGMTDESGNANSMTWTGIANNAFRGNASVDKPIHNKREHNYGGSRLCFNG